jgi:F-type H+-transporting ATPase subunit a
MTPAPVFRPPGSELFDYSPMWPGAPYWLTKPVALALLSALIVCALLWTAFARPRPIPRGLQNLAETGYLFVRDHIARPYLGRDSDRWMGLLLSIFFLVLTWNLVGSIPLLQIPVTAYIAFPGVIALAVYLLKITLGLRTHGGPGYLRSVISPGLPTFIYFFLIPIELLETFLFSLFTHMIRVVANMFAGHLLLAFFSAVGYWFLFERPTPAGIPVGILGVAVAVLMTAFEIFIQILQAYLFTLLTAMYIGETIEGKGESRPPGAGRVRPHDGKETGQLPINAMK